MTQSDYLVVGGSHAGLAAIDAIRMLDPAGSIMLLTREDRLPYSPTILPYVVTGRVSPDRAVLREEDQLKQRDVTFRPGSEVIAVDPGRRRVNLSSGETIEYGKLLLATGAVPEVPPIPGLDSVPFHVLRTMGDALSLHERMADVRKAVVLGAGLIGLHAAECLVDGGCEVTVVEALPQILPGYFEPAAARLVEEIIAARGVRLLTGCRMVTARQGGKGMVAVLDAGDELEADLLLVAAGVRCATGYLNGSGIPHEQGIGVDERMRTGVPDVWAAGDVAQAKPFFGEESTVIPNVMNAVGQGRIAGLDMAGDSNQAPYAGSLAANTSAFFGHRAFSVGLGASCGDEDEMKIHENGHGSQLPYLNMVFREDRLVGAAGIDADLDPGILAELIRRGVDLSQVRKDMVRDPKATGRILMSRIWG